MTTIDQQLAQIRAMYTAYLERFRDLYGAADVVAPMTLQQFCANITLEAAAEHTGMKAEAKELRDIRLEPSNGQS